MNRRSLQGHPFRVVLRPAILAAVWLALSLAPRSARADGPQESQKVPLHSGWSLQSSCKFTANPEQISTVGFKTEGWHSTDVPSTVVAALVADKTYPDPYYGKNLRDIPGTTYPIGKNFSLLPMSKDSPFHCSWWYRTEFTLAPNFDGRHVWLLFRRHQQSRQHLAQRPSDSLIHKMSPEPTRPTSTTFRLT